MASPSISGRSTGRRLPGDERNVQHGFSLLEMATVLFLVSLLFGGALRASELISTSHVKGLAEDFLNVSRMLHTYQDMFRAQPGDDLMAASHLGVNAQLGNGNGIIEGKWNDTGDSSEASRVWQHLRLAGLARGGRDFSAPDYTPVNALGHPMGLQSATSNPAQSPIRNLLGGAIPGYRIICSRGIPGKFVVTLDTKLDDGNPATGNMLATVDKGAAYTSGASAATVATNLSTDIQPDQSYIVCLGV